MPDFSIVITSAIRTLPNALVPVALLTSSAMANVRASPMLKIGFRRFFSLFTSEIVIRWGFRRVVGHSETGAKTALGVLGDWAVPVGGPKSQRTRTGLLDRCVMLRF